MFYLGLSARANSPAASTRLFYCILLPKTAFIHVALYLCFITTEYDDTSPSVWNFGHYTEEGHNIQDTKYWKVTAGSTTRIMRFAAEYERQDIAYHCILQLSLVWADAGRKIPAIFAALPKANKSQRYTNR